MFEIGTQLRISRSHGYLEVCSKSPKVRDTDISLYLLYLPGKCLLAITATLNSNQFNSKQYDCVNNLVTL